MRRALGGLDPEQCVLPVKTQVKWQVDDWAPVKTRKDFHPLVCVCVFLLKCYCVYCFFFWFRVEFFVKTFIRSKFKTSMLHFEAQWGTALEKWVCISGTSGKNRPASYFHPSRRVSPAVCGFTQEEGGASAMLCFDLFMREMKTSLQLMLL